MKVNAEATLFPPHGTSKISSHKETTRRYITLQEPTVVDIHQTVTPKDAIGLSAYFTLNTNEVRKAALGCQAKGGEKALANRTSTTADQNQTHAQ